MTLALVWQLAVALAGTPKGTPAPSPGAPSDSVPERRYAVERGTVLIYRGPRLSNLVSGVPATLAATVRSTVQREHLLTVGGVVASSVILIAYDQQLLDETRRFSARIHLSQAHPSIDIRAGPIKVIAIPKTISSGLYFLGDGWTDILLAGGFGAYGTLRHDWRAQSTATQIASALIASGAITQTLKRITGRQSPRQATASGGLWRPLPGFKEFNANVDSYDAFPSGHLSDAMATVTIIAGNYPERRWIRPVGYSLMAGLSLAMVNSGVHWVGDYPAALAIGALVGEITVARGRSIERDGIQSTKHSVHFIPLLAPNAIGVRIPLSL
ncbi:MAG: phosphatase PAP2 family protein [Gemmatimonadota bacterium]|nr:phosphatase PAP2 family protein [Gemmatimonadota bacterium]